MTLYRESGESSNDEVFENVNEYFSWLMGANFAGLKYWDHTLRSSPGTEVVSLPQDHVSSASVSGYVNLRASALFDLETARDLFAASYGLMEELPEMPLSPVDRFALMAACQAGMEVAAYCLLSLEPEPDDQVAPYIQLLQFPIIYSPQNLYWIDVGPLLMYLAGKTPGCDCAFVLTSTDEDYDAISSVIMLQPRRGASCGHAHDFSFTTQPFNRVPQLAAMLDVLPRAGLSRTPEYVDDILALANGLRIAVEVNAAKFGSVTRYHEIEDDLSAFVE